MAGEKNIMYLIREAGQERRAITPVVGEQEVRYFLRGRSAGYFAWWEEITYYTSSGGSSVR